MDIRIGKWIENNNEANAYITDKGELHWGDNTTTFSVERISEEDAKKRWKQFFKFDPRFLNV